MRSDFINDPLCQCIYLIFKLLLSSFKVSSRERCSMDFWNHSQAIGTIPWSQKQKRGPASTSRFLVHSSVFCTYNKTRVVGCKLKRQIGCSKRQDTMYRKQLNWTGKQFGLSKQFKFSRRMIIPFSSICLSANLQYVYLKFLWLQSKPSQKPSLAILLVHQVQRRHISHQCWGHRSVDKRSSCHTTAQKDEDD